MGVAIPTVLTPSGVSMLQASPTPSGASLGNSGQLVPDALSNAAETIGRQADQFTQQINGTLALDATNKLKARAAQLTYGQPTDTRDPTTGGFMNVSGSAALGSNGRPAILDTYPQQLQEYANNLAAGLHGGAAAMFQQQAQSTQDEFGAQLLQHVQNQAEVAHREAMQNAYQTALANAAASPNSASTIAGGMNTLDMLYGDVLNRAGVEAADAAITPLKSKYLSTIIQARIQAGDIGNAQAFFSNNVHDMQASDIMTIGGQLQNEGARQTGIAAAQTGTQPLQAQWDPPPNQTLQNVVRSIESGGKGDTNPDGTQLLGQPTPDGQRAMYAMQVLPTTAHDANYLGPLGVTPAKDDSAAEYDRVGSQMLDGLLTRYHGNAQQAMAAYTAGYGAVDKAIADNGANWLQALGPNTQAYVAKGTAALQAGNTAPQMLTQNQYINAAVAALPANPTPQMVEAARSHAVELYNSDLQAFNVRKENAISSWQSAIVAANGDTSRILPATVQAVNRYAPGEAAHMNAFAAAVNGTTNPTTDNATFSRMITDPTWLGSLTPSQYEQIKMTKIAPADRGKADDMRNTAAPQTAAVPQQQVIDTASINNAINPRLASMGLTGDTLTGSSKLAADEQAARIRVNFLNHVVDLQTSLGRKLSPAETQQAADQFLSQTAAPPPAHWYNWGTQPAKPLAAFKPDELPNNLGARARAALVKNGVTNPTDEQVMNLVLKAHP